MDYNKEEFSKQHDNVCRLDEMFYKVAIQGITTSNTIIDYIEESGISIEDYRLPLTRKRLKELGDISIDRDLFESIISKEILFLSRIFRRQLIIPDWPDFCQANKIIFKQTALNISGHNADYIPILRDADPDKWGLAICSVDGQRFCIGDVDVYHSIQSVSKPISYAYSLANEGEAFTHEFVGIEPSGRPFNALDLLPDMRPYNPCVNAGAIMVAGIIASSHQDKSAREITQKLMDLWNGLCGFSGDVLFSEETMRSERATAHNNFAIAYLLQARKGLPRDVDLYKMLDLYLSCCSIEITTAMLSVAAATLANGGVCPLTGQQVLSTEVVKKTLAVMQFAGMYDNAGTFTLEVGLPAKSGVSGIIMVVVPNLIGFATFSPRLDAYGNSVRGVDFCRELVNRFTFHVYDSLSGGRTGCKQDPRESQYNRKQKDVSDLRWALAYGDQYASKVFDLILTSMIDICIADGDIEESEVNVITDAICSMTGSALSKTDLVALAEARQSHSHDNSSFNQLIKRLSEEQSKLDDNARSLILESAFKVACADGVIEEKEYEQLMQIADALGIYHGVLEIEINRFKRHFDQKNSSSV